MDGYIPNITIKAKESFSLRNDYRITKENKRALSSFHCWGDSMNDEHEKSFLTTKGRYDWFHGLQD